MLGYVCSWVHYDVWKAVLVPAQHVVDPFWFLNITQNVAYQVFLDLAVFFAPSGGSFVIRSNVGALLASEMLSVWVACFVSLGNI